jgi:hypothetical protein
LLTYIQVHWLFPCHFHFAIEPTQEFLRHCIFQFKNFHFLVSEFGYIVCFLYIEEIIFLFFCWGFLSFH